MTDKIKLPRASVPKEFVDALINAFFQAGTPELAEEEGLFLWKYQSPVMDDKANLCRISIYNSLLSF